MVRVPRKLKKKLKKDDLYEKGFNLNLCLVCQKKKTTDIGIFWLCKKCIDNESNNSDNNISSNRVSFGVMW